MVDLGAAGLYVTGHKFLVHLFACSGFRGGWSGILVFCMRIFWSELVVGEDSVAVAVVVVGTDGIGAKGESKLYRTFKSGSGGGIKK